MPYRIFQPKKKKKYIFGKCSNFAPFTKYSRSPMIPASEKDGLKQFDFRLLELRF